MVVEMTAWERLALRELVKKLAGLEIEVSMMTLTCCFLFLFLLNCFGWHNGHIFFNVYKDLIEYIFTLSVFQCTLCGCGTIIQNNARCFHCRCRIAQFLLDGILVVRWMEPNHLSQTTWSNLFWSDKFIVHNPSVSVTTIPLSQQPYPQCFRLWSVAWKDFSKLKGLRLNYTQSAYLRPQFEGWRRSGKSSSDLINFFVCCTKNYHNKNLEKQKKGNKLLLTSAIVKYTYNKLSSLSLICFNFLIYQRHFWRQRRILKDISWLFKFWGLSLNGFVIIASWWQRR